MPFATAPVAWRHASRPAATRMRCARHPSSRIASIVARHGAAASESTGMTVSSNTHHTPRTGHANA